MQPYERNAHSESPSPPPSPFCPLVEEEEEAESILELIIGRVQEHLTPGQTVLPLLPGCCGFLMLPLVSRVLEAFLRGVDPYRGSSALQKHETTTCLESAEGRVLSNGQHHFHSEKGMTGQV